MPPKAAARYSESAFSFGVCHVDGSFDYGRSVCAIRHFSNGFRAPTLAEEYYSSTSVSPTSAFVQLPPNSPGGKLLGLGTGLQAEKTINYSLGFVFRPVAAMSVTLDLYQITVTNRIVGSANLYGSIFGTLQSPAVNAGIAANGNQLDPAVVAAGITGVNIFSNGIDTRTQGADLVLNFPVNYGFGHVNYSIGATFTDTAATRVPPVPALLAGQTMYDSQAISDLTSANPKFKVNLGLDWTAGNASVDVLETVYGPASEWETDDADNPTGAPQYFRSRIGTTAITDVGLSYTYNNTSITNPGRTPPPPPQLAGNILYNIQAYSDLTTATPR